MQSLLKNWRKIIGIKTIIFRRTFMVSNKNSSEFNSSSSDSSDTEGKDSNSEDIKSKILEASLDFVNDHGWSQKALALGSEKAGLSPMSHGLFKKNAVELVHYFNKSRNQKLLDDFLKNPENIESKSVRYILENSVKYRLELLVPYLPNWTQAMVILTLPANIPEAFKIFGHLVDDMWYHAGDKSSDMSWYTKRLTLGTIYKLTELHLIQDSSNHYQDTWRFLTNRFNNMDSLNRGCYQIKESGNILNSVYQLTRNVLNMNDFKR